MIESARDVMVAIALDLRLGQLRERQMELLEAGERLPVDFWVAGQRAIRDALLARFYHEELRVALSGEGERGRSDEEAFDARESRLAEYAILLTHRRLVDMPCVGDPAVRDD